MAYLHVKIHHGPCKTVNSLSPDTSKIEILKGELLKLGFRVSLIREEYINYCMLEMCGHQIFRCNINDLLQKRPSEDQTCQQAVRAGEDASVKFLRADTYFWLWSLLEQQIFLRNKYSPKPVWPVTLDFGGKFGLNGPKCPCGCVKL